MDTWATSSMTPQIAGRWFTDPDLYARVFPFALRPQSHEIIRTWVFDTIVKSFHHFGKLPWKTIMISGWGLAGAGGEKISKSRGGGPMAPIAMIERYSSDAVRYWAASTGPGKDSLISEEKIKNGGKLITKLWNVARFSERFLANYQPAEHKELTPTDRWLLARLATVIQRTTSYFEDYEYSAAKNEIETFFWHDLADNYLEMAKSRLYGEAGPVRAGAYYTLYHVLLSTLKLFAPFLPYVTDEIYRGLFAQYQEEPSIHSTHWPEVQSDWVNIQAEQAGELLLEVATAVRRYKSEQGISLGAELGRLLLSTSDPDVAVMLEASRLDILSVTRAKELSIGADLPLNGTQEMWRKEEVLTIALEQ